MGAAKDFPATDAARPAGRAALERLQAAANLFPTREHIDAGVVWDTRNNLPAVKTADTNRALGPRLSPTLAAAKSAQRTPHSADTRAATAPRTATTRAVGGAAAL
ncbi:hypothetical protein [Streptomonospora nanhaiensis]|uniref:Uncharacterized protein n=1 Tax=Streptomonospora nanhaiensis TaxID=1323731 RepID=A0A853BKB3_9ACTN|nr:hypothetical protein [Streptomonospora nanhaiensis]MBV2363100.1 hypothetical protein [Streptomonospora nanhaiensis]NYI95470.1 hypothetical protein [Streptomonospora nanhaiensis]